MADIIDLKACAAKRQADSIIPLFDALRQSIRAHIDEVGDYPASVVIETYLLVLLAEVDEADRPEIAATLRRAARMLMPRD